MATSKRAAIPTKPSSSYDRVIRDDGNGCSAHRFGRQPEDDPLSYFGFRLALTTDN